MRTTLLSFVDELGTRGAETAFVHRAGLRVIRWSREQIRVTALQFARELPGEITVKFGEPVSYLRGEDPARITKDLERRIANL